MRTKLLKKIRKRYPYRIIDGWVFTTNKEWPRKHNIPTYIFNACEELGYSEFANRIDVKSKIAIQKIWADCREKINPIVAEIHAMNEELKKLAKQLTND